MKKNKNKNKNNNKNNNKNKNKNKNWPKICKLAHTFLWEYS